MPFGSRNHLAGGQRREVLYHLPFSARYCLPMGLNIKNEYVHELARRAATATGKTQTGAIEEALERLLAAYGAVASLAYGALLNLWFWPFVAGDGTAVSFVPGDAVVANLRRFWGFHLATLLGWDVVRAATTVVLCMSLGRPVIGALTRVRRRAAFGAIATFEP